MSKAKINLVFAMAVLLLPLLACNLGRDGKQVFVNTNSSTHASTDTNSTKTNETDTDASTSGAERSRPAPGKGNVQGRVLYNDQPVEGIEVKICQNFSTILGIKCEGKTSTTKTDKDGVFVLSNLEPETYGGLTARVFKSDYFIYPQEGIMSPRKFLVEADRTIFAPDIYLFKDDVKITHPKAGSKVDLKDLELKWDAYPDAAYYKVSLYPDAGGLSPISGDRVDEPSYAVTDELTNGKYRLKVEVFNANDRKLAESSNDTKFTLTGGKEPEPKQ